MNNIIKEYVTDSELNKIVNFRTYKQEEIKIKQEEYINLSSKMYEIMNDIIIKEKELEQDDINKVIKFAIEYDKDNLLYNTFIHNLGNLYNKLIQKKKKMNLDFLNLYGIYYHFKNGLDGNKLNSWLKINIIITTINDNTLREYIIQILDDTINEIFKKDDIDITKLKYITTHILNLKH
jgi:hypothetical protein